MRVHLYLQEHVHTHTHTHTHTPEQSRGSPLPLRRGWVPWEQAPCFLSVCVRTPHPVCRGAVLGDVRSHAPLSLTTRPFSSTPSQNALTEISEWLENHPQEGVILACRNSEGMMEDLHEYLMGCIKNIFGDMLCPRGVRRGQRLPVLLAAGALGFTVIRLSVCCMRLIQIPGDTAHGTPVIHTPLSPLKHPSNQPITGHRHPQ